MISINDHIDNTGRIDWVALKKAQIDAGECCFRCNTLILFPKGFKTLCNSCNDLDTSTGEVTHPNHVRCPGCSAVFDMHDGDLEEYHTEDTHEINCEACDHQFEFQTHVQLSFTSPPLCISTDE